MAPLKKKLKCDFNYVDDGRVIQLAAGTILNDKQIKLVKEIQPNWIASIEEEIEEESDEGRIKDLRLTEPEKPAKPKDEDPKDPDKPKK